MNDRNYAQIAAHLLQTLLMTGDGGAVTQVLQQYVPPVGVQTDEQFLAELHMIWTAYCELLAQVDVIAAAKQPEFVGLRMLIKQVLEKRLQEGENRKPMQERREA